MRKRLSAYLSRLRPHLRTAGIVLLVLALAVAWYWFLWLPASALVEPKDRVTAQDEAFRTLLQLVGGAAILFGGYTAWRTLRATQKQVEIARQGQITDRFHKAVDHLGSKDLIVRLGGIYALESIAKESKDHHWPVMEVLTAFVRKKVPHKEEEQKANQVESDAHKSTDEPEPGKPDFDIQAVLTVIGRRSTELAKKEQYLDLNHTDLHGADLRRTNLTRVHLRQANLTEADLKHANLTGVHFRRAKLTKADLTEADLTEADLTKVDLSGANLSEANLVGAYTLDENGNRHLVTDEQLEVAKSCKGATMPNGTKHP